MNCEGDGIEQLDSRAVPEQRLMLALLVDAINILKGPIPTHDCRKRQDFVEAARWVAIRGTHYLFTFDSVCDALNLPVEMLRARLSRLARGREEANRTGIGRLRRRPANHARTIKVDRARSQTQTVSTDDPLRSKSHEARADNGSKPWRRLLTRGLSWRVPRTLQFKAEFPI